MDFLQTFALTPSAVSMKIAVAIAKEKYWLLVNEVMNMRLPAGCGDMSSDIVLLQHLVNVLRQDGKEWNLRSSFVLL